MIGGLFFQHLFVRKVSFDWGMDDILLMGAKAGSDAQDQETTNN